MPAPATRTSSCGRRTRRASWCCAARRRASCTSRPRAAAAMAAGSSSRCNRLPCPPRNRSRADRSRPLRRGPRSPVRAASRRGLRSAVRLGAAALACALVLACASAPRAGTAEPSQGSSADAGVTSPDAGATSRDAGVALDGGTADAGLDAGVSSADAGPRPEVLALVSRAEAKAREGDPASLAEAARLWEEAAPGLPDPERVLLPAARARRERAQRTDAVPDEVPADAEACAADAWQGIVATDPEARKGSRGEAIARVGPAAAELLYLDAV